MTLRILGAGVMGLALATELTARGHAVEIHDPADAPGPHACSWWAGGMLAPWCERESAEEPVLRLGLEAIDWWQRHTGLVERQGTLVLAPGRDRADMDRFARRTTGHRPLDAQGIADLEPDLAGRFATGLHFPDEAHLPPRAALTELRRRLEAAGVPFHSGAPAGVPGSTVGGTIAPAVPAPVDPVGAAARAPAPAALPDPQADAEPTLSTPAPTSTPRLPPPPALIDCRGLAARDALRDLRGVRGEMLVLRCPDITLSRPIRMLHPRIPIYIVPRGDGIFMLGATMIESDRRGVVTVRSVLELLTAAYTLHPAFAEAEILETGADARPAFPDNLPRLRRRGDTLHANGLYRHGFLLSPALARMAAEHLETGAAPELMDEVTP